MDTIEIIGFIAALITIIGFLTKRGRQFFKKLWFLVSRYQPKIPRQTLRILQEESRSRWSSGKLRKEPAMHISGHFFVTNISHVEVFICKVVMKKPKIHGGILVRQPEGNIYGSYGIPPNVTTEASVDFWIKPPIRKEDEFFTANIVFIDQFTNDHKVNKVKFSPSPKIKCDESPPLEVISGITNAVERQVVSVLQAELSRYNNCGRSVGGLGSIQTIHKDESFKGVGMAHGASKSPEQHDVVQDPENSMIKSDNAKALIDYFSTLDNQQKEDFIESLLNRISSSGPYAPIGYFILFVLFHVGHLNKALAAAKKHLQGDPAYGFSDLLILLSGLLRYEHPKFTNEMLDEVEQFLVGIKDSTFRIQEKLVAIRALRLAEDISKDKASDSSTEEGEIEEKGIWDYVVLSEKSMDKLKECAERITEAMEEIGKKMQKRTQEAQDIQKRSLPGTASRMHKLVKATAYDMNLYAKKIEEEQPKLHLAWNEFEENTAGFIEIANIKTDEDKKAIVNYSNVVKGLKDENIKALESIRTFRKTVDSLIGISSDVNRASRRIISVLDLLINDFVTADSNCSKIISLLDEKLETVKNL